MPPPPVEAPFTLVYKKSGGRRLTDEEVIQCRLDVVTVSVKELAERHNVNYQTMWKATRGWSYRHLNLKHVPQW